MSTEPVVDGRGLALARDLGPGIDTGIDTGIDAEVDVTRLRVALARLSRRLRRHELAGLTPTQLAALSTIEKAGPMRLGDLAAAEGIAPSTLTRLVTALEDSGYVQRTADPSDARASTLAITAHGQEALERIRAENTLMLMASLELLTPEQRSAGGQCRYTRYEIRVIQQVVSMADEGITLQAIRRIIDLEQQLAEVTRERDELARRLAEHR